MLVDQKYTKQPAKVQKLITVQKHRALKPSRLRINSFSGYLSFRRYHAPSLSGSVFNLCCNGLMLYDSSCSSHFEPAGNLYDEQPARILITEP